MWRRPNLATCLHVLLLAMTLAIDDSHNIWTQKKESSSKTRREPRIKILLGMCASAFARGALINLTGETSKRTTTTGRGRTWHTAPLNILQRRADSRLVSALGCGHSAGNRLRSGAAAAPPGGRLYLVLQKHCAAHQRYSTLTNCDSLPIIPKAQSKEY